MKIGIIGLGLIGGSLGLDLTRQGYDVIGVSRQLSTCNIALAKQIVTDASVDFSVLEQTDLIFICTPIAAILPTIESIINYLRPSTIITDVGSVKGAISHKATELWKNFVGSHPMAGTTNQGIEAAESNLFQNAPCVITPVKNTSMDAMNKVSEIWRSLGCKVYTSTPEIHDQAVAWISHLPVMISANLINSCVKNHNQEVVKLAQNLASSGFKDTSRVGGGNVELGLMMAKYNREQLLISLIEYQQNLQDIISNIEQEKWEELEIILKKSHQERPSFIDFQD
ncbi:arogenate dehydrogenase [Geminocystis sp. NIES-3708]|uniref:prephenate/arogenate dehydrogenase n=1 Tax=Geminocystis sp. NIES-3708 TaxID=1615909 RepID=UPI0005FCBE96|nr:prephenate/arogenate dehydrogenase [Geminocystis sp. NIES-3708]BAQ61292.1 arogenate dehydrogenase [Geminocystis sp. NIES-3708]